MKTRIHRWLLGLTLLFLMPGTLLACLALVGMIGNSVQNGFRTSDLFVIPILLIPAIFICWGFGLLAGLRQGVHRTLRRQLLAFHLAVLVYCSLWLFSTVSHNGVKSAIFPVEIQFMGFAVLILPALITLFTYPEAKRVWNPGDGENPRLNRQTDRFVAWLASRIR